MSFSFWGELLFWYWGGTFYSFKCTWLELTYIKVFRWKNHGSYSVGISIPQCNLCISLRAHFDKVSSMGNGRHSVMFWDSKVKYVNRIIPCWPRTFLVTWLSIYFSLLGVLCPYRGRVSPILNFPARVMFSIQNSFQEICCFWENALSRKLL